MEQNRNFDVIVVGAGVVGCSIAYHLTQAGFKTALLDQGQVGAGASGANMGMVQSDDAELKYSIPMVTTSYSRYDHLEEELGMPVGFRRMATLSLISTEDQWKANEERVNTLARCGVACELIPASRIAEIEPMVDASQLIGAVYAPYQGQLSPFRLMWAYVHRGIQKGLSLYTFTEVTGFDFTGGRVRSVHTRRGNFSAGVVVLATAAWTRRLGEMVGSDWKIFTFRASAMVTEPVYDLHLGTIVSTVDRIEMEVTGKNDTELIILGISQTPEGNYLIAQANRPGDELVAAISHVAPKAIARMANRFFPMLGKVRVLRTWTAPTTYTDDGCPFVGPVGGLQGMILAAGFRSAVVNAPIAGEMITQVVNLGRCDVVNIAPFSPDRQIQQEAEPIYKVKRAES